MSAVIKLSPCAFNSIASFVQLYLTQTGAKRENVMPECGFCGTYLAWCIPWSVVQGFSVWHEFGGTSWSLFFQNVFGSFLSPAVPFCSYYTSYSFATVLGCFVELLLLFSSPLIFKGSIDMSHVSESLSSAVSSQSTNEPLKAVFISVAVSFWTLIFISGSFLDFPALCSHCPPALAWCLLHALEPSAQLS